MAAWALALVLVSQSVIGALALGAAAGGPQFDAFGNPLCVTGVERSGGGEHLPSDHSRLPDCCGVACSMFWQSLPVPTDFAGIVLNPRVETRAAFAGYRIDAAGTRGDHEPGNPRAPPLTA